MSNLSFTLLYVQDPLASAAFYQRLLGVAPVESSPGFAMFVFGPGWRLGLWKRDDVRPVADAGAGAAELGIEVTSAAEVERTCAAWRALGVTMLQAPTTMDFGHTFTAADPDGHRLRVFAPSAA
jgi:catechol 2,3-dioxygenase-like lactoylglutathione lyase family enzyme